jgi:hypothetical protein
MDSPEGSLLARGRERRCRATRFFCPNPKAAGTARRNAPRETRGARATSPRRHGLPNPWRDRRQPLRGTFLGSVAGVLQGRDWIIFNSTPRTPSALCFIPLCAGGRLPDRRGSSTRACTGPYGRGRGRAFIVSSPPPPLLPYPPPFLAPFPSQFVAGSSPSARRWLPGGATLFHVDPCACRLAGSPGRERAALGVRGLAPVRSNPCISRSWLVGR